MGNESGVCSFGCIFVVLILIIVFWEQAQVFFGLVGELITFLGDWIGDVIGAWG